MGRKRVLCLHGHGCDSRIFRIQLMPVLSACRPDVDFVFLDGPQEADMTDPSILEYFPAPQFQHLQYMRPIRSPDGTRYEGVEAGLQHVRTFLQTDGPFDGLLGFSQGANLATLLTAEAESQTGRAPWDFVVLMCGGRSLWAEGLPDLPLRTPSLHVISKDDPSWELTEALVDVYSAGSRQVIRTEGGHKPPRDPAVLAVVRSFIAGAGAAGPTWSEDDLLA
eukprot:EG_transcript_25768